MGGGRQRGGRSEPTWRVGWEVGVGDGGSGEEVGGGRGGGGKWDVGGMEVGEVGGGRYKVHGNRQVRFDRFDRRSDSMPVFAVSVLGMLYNYSIMHTQALLQLVRPLY